MRSVKEPLRKVLGQSVVGLSRVGNVLTRIDAVINSRPLTIVSDDIRDLTTITPAHLALGRSLFKLPDHEDEVSANKSTTRQRYLYQQKLINHFLATLAGRVLTAVIRQTEVGE